MKQKGQERSLVNFEGQEKNEVKVKARGGGGG